MSFLQGSEGGVCSRLGVFSVYLGRVEAVPSLRGSKGIDLEFRIVYQVSVLFPIYSKSIRKTFIEVNFKENFLSLSVFDKRW